MPRPFAGIGFRLRNADIANRHSRKGFQSGGRQSRGLPIAQGKTSQSRRGTRCFRGDTFLPSDRGSGDADRAASPQRDKNRQNGKPAGQANQHVEAVNGRQIFAQSHPSGLEVSEGEGLKEQSIDKEEPRQVRHRLPGSAVLPIRARQISHRPSIVRGKHGFDSWIATSTRRRLGWNIIGRWPARLLDLGELPFGPTSRRPCRSSRCSSGCNGRQLLHFF